MSTRWLIGGCSAIGWHRCFSHWLVGSNLSCALRSEPALVERLHPEMRLSSKAWGFARSVSLLAAVLVCLGAFLWFVPTELEICTALGPAHSHPLDRGVDEGYLAVAQEEEALGADKVGANADQPVEKPLYAPSEHPSRTQKPRHRSVLALMSKCLAAVLDY
jgi:hypothetical protein